MTKHDQKWMRRCVELAQRGAGYVSPNPLVGCVIVGANGEVIAEGAHLEFGGPHAERNALAEVDPPDRSLADATLYVNLEPCSHHGKTPPCAEAISKAGVQRVVVGMQDPFPAVAGQGIEKLRRAGIRVDVGVCSEECFRLNEAFVHHVQTGRPLVTLKVAQTLDGQVATKTGDSKWISGLESRARVHRWRSELDAVLVGSGTATHDDPRLTVRHVEGRQPLRIVLDRQGTLSAELQLFTDEHVDHTVAVISEDVAEATYAQTLSHARGHILRIPETAEGHLNLRRILQQLGGGVGPDERPVQSVMVEAGPGLATALFKQDLVDRYFCFLAPKVLGEGRPPIGDLGIDNMAGAITFETCAWEPVGADMLFKGFRRTG